MVPLYLETAEMLLDKQIPAEVLAKALACIDGNYKKIAPRSLINGDEGVETLQMILNNEFESSNDVWTHLKRLIPERYL